MCANVHGGGGKIMVFVNNGRVCSSSNYTGSDSERLVDSVALWSRCASGVRRCIIDELYAMEDTSCWEMVVKGLMN